MKKCTEKEQKKMKKYVKNFLHFREQNFNFRLLMVFDEKDTPKFLVAFYERAGKKKTDYTQYKKVLDSRFEEV